jgi:hypothetical protein
MNQNASGFILPPSSFTFRVPRQPAHPGPPHPPPAPDVGAGGVSENPDEPAGPRGGGPAPAALEGTAMLFFGRKKRLTDYASCAG